MKKFDFGDVTPQKVIRYMKALSGVAKWCLTTRHKEAGAEVRAILFEHIPEILNPKKEK